MVCFESTWINKPCWCESEMKGWRPWFLVITNELIVKLVTWSNLFKHPCHIISLFHQFHCHYSLYYHYSTYLYPGDLVSVVMHIPTPTQPCQLWASCGYSVRESGTTGSVTKVSMISISDHITSHICIPLRHFSCRSLSWQWNVPFLHRWFYLSK